MFSFLNRKNDINLRRELPGAHQNRVISSALTNQEHSGARDDRQPLCSYLHTHRPYFHTIRCNFIRNLRAEASRCRSLYNKAQSRRHVIKWQNISSAPRVEIDTFVMSRNIAPHNWVMQMRSRASHGEVLLRQQKELISFYVKPPFALYFPFNNCVYS